MTNNYEFVLVSHNHLAILRVLYIYLESRGRSEQPVLRVCYLP